MSNRFPQVSRRSFLGAGTALAAASAMPILSGAASSLAAPWTHARVNVSLIANALSAMGQNPMQLSMTAAIKPLVNVGRTIIGPAVTTKWEVGRGRSEAEAIRQFVFQPIDEAPPGSIWVVASGTDRILSMFGDVIAQACIRQGMLGAVTDSGCRDINGATELGFPVFARSAVPYGPGSFIRPVAANVPVVCGGAEVRPGDLVAADSDGVIVIPAELVEELSVAVAKQLEKEQEMRRKLEAGASLVEAYSL